MEKVVYVIGSFDLFHRGHVELLRRARALGDIFILSIIKKLFVNMVLILLFMGMIGVVCLIWNKFV